MKINLPSFKHREKRMYVFLALHLLFLSIIIANASLPGSVTYWMNEVAATFVNNVVNLFKGVKPIYPKNISIDNYSHTFLSYYYDSEPNRFHILEGESFYIHVKLEFPESSQENLKHKDLSVRSSDGRGVNFSADYNGSLNRLVIYGMKASKNNQIKLVSPNNKSVAINFDVVNKITPDKENIYLSNTDVKIGSSFYISSLYLECFQDKILEDDYQINKLEDVVSGGRYYSNSTRDATYWPSLSEGTTLKYLNLNNHQYISDDPNIRIDESLGIVSVSEGVRVGDHVITSNFNGEIHFTVFDEHVSPISISELSIKSIDAYVNPGQSESGYIGQTIQLDNVDILNDHALTFSSSSSDICKIDLKKHLFDGTFVNKGELFLRGNKTGECDVRVQLYDNESIKLDYHVKCDTLENILNYKIVPFIDDEPYKEDVLNVVQKYKFLIKMFDNATETYLNPDRIAFSKSLDRYLIEGEYITFKVDGEPYVQFEYAYKGVERISGRAIFKTYDKNKSAYSNVNHQTVRKIVGHGMFHFLCSLFLILFLLVYFKDHKLKWYSFAMVAISSFLLAGLTEAIQLIVPGRYPNFSDVLFDYLFSLGALLIVGIIYLIKHLCKTKQILSKKT